MTNWAAAFHALNVPLLLFSLGAAFLLARDVLLPAWRRNELTLRHHGLPGAIALGFTADAAQTVYYAHGRLLPELWPTLYHAYGPLSALRLLVLASSLLAMATYAAIAGWRWHWPYLIGLAALLWAGAFAFLLWRMP